MYIEIPTKESLLEELKKRMYEDTNIHYICEYCDDEQVTGKIYVEDEIIKTLEKEDCIYVHYECTNERCGYTTKFIYSNYITGIEDW